MADIKISMMLQDSGDSVGKATSKTKALNEQLERTKKLASTAFASSKAAPSMAAQGFDGEMEGFSRSRGTIGTGAAGRDFSNQAQGLGGLVRVYATLAANIFAATAAFGALSRAMDTTNMVEGLNQLGSASGIALGSLSKRLVTATDGALSLREAMEATTKAVSSGLNTDDVLRLGKVAKQASQALGVDMGDAVSRLTRGITKLEPELLDELGIFTRLDPAVKEYAKSVNKSVTELTTFERRMAFANAVLAEGEQKFGKINIDTNPYTKLSASVRDAAQQILEFINKALAPVAKFFAESPTALLLGISGIAAILIKQALPALGEFKAGLQQTTERAQELAKTRAEDALKARQLINSKIVAQVEALADKEVAAADRAQKRVEELQQSGLKKRGLALKLLQKDYVDVTPKDIARVEQAATRFEARGKTQEAAAYREAAAAVRAQIEAEKTLIETKKTLTQQVEKDAQGWGTYGLVVKASQRAQDAALKSSIISNAAYNGSLIGITDSVRLLREEVAKNNIKGFAASMLVARGAIAAVGGAISTVVNAIGGFLAVIGLIITAVSIFDGIFSKAGDALSDFSGSMDRTKESTKTLKNTFDTIYSTNPFSVQSLEAQSNALQEVSTSIDLMANSAQKALRAISPRSWDGFKNTIKSIVGLDVQSQFTKTLSQSIAATVSGIDDKALKERVSSSIGGILSVKDVTNVKELDKALEGLKPGSSTIRFIRDLLKEVSTEAANAASKAKDVSTAFEGSKEAFRLLQNQFEVKDPLTTWANESITTLTKLSKNLDGPITQSITNLVQISGNLDKNPIFGSSSISVAEFNSELAKLQKTLVSSEQQAQFLEQQLADAQKARETLAKEAAADRNLLATTMGIGPVAALKELDSNIANLQNAVQQARADRSKAEASATTIAVKIRSSINTGLTESLDIVAKGIQASLAKGSTQVLQNIYSRIDIVPELAAKQFDLKIRELDQQAALIRSQKDLSNETSLLAAELAVTNARQSLQTAKEDLKSSSSPRKIDIALEQVSFSEKELTAATEKLKLLKTAATDPAQAIKNLNQATKSGASEVSSYSKEIVDAANRNTGFLKSLRDIADQQKLIKLVDEPLALEAGRARLEKESLDNKLKQNSVDRDNIKLAQQKEDSDRASLLSKAESNEVSRASLELEQKLAAIKTEYNNRIIIGNALAQQGRPQEAEKLYQAAEGVRLLEEENARKEYTVKLGQTQNSTAKERLKLFEEELNKRKEINDIYRQIQDVAFTGTTSIQEAELILAENKLSVQEKQRGLTKEQLSQAQLQIELARQELELQQQRRSLLQRQADLVEKLSQKANMQAMANQDNSETLRQLQQAREANLLELKGFDQLAAAKRESLKLNKTLKTDQENLADIYEETFNKMSDVIVDFVKTGKLNFKSLIDDMLAQILRMYANKMFSKMFADLLPFLPGMGGGYSGGLPSGLIPSGVAMAKGGVFDDGAKKYYQGGVFELGMPKFAKGGTFTNTIVDQPTNFRFAKGIGLMGEAGPEAIMPLKRDSQGNLGVRSNSSNTNVEVVVNNYSKDSARTEETTDSQGNRRIEVIIGDMTATEVSRNGSGTQKAMRGTFGLQPQLIRR